MKYLYFLIRAKILCRVGIHGGLLELDVWRCGLCLSPLLPVERKEPT